MMILLALSLAAASADKDTLDSQIMNSPAFEQFARAAERVCPARRLRYLSPAGLAGKEEGFEPHLSAKARKRLEAADPHWKGCVNQAAGPSCPAQHTLGAMIKLGMLPSFTRFACASGG